MSKPPADFSPEHHDPEDPSPWLALYLDRSTPLPDHVKTAWLQDSSSKSRQYLLPFLRPLCRALIIVIQVIKTLLPKRWSHSTFLHKMLVWGLKRYVSPQANWLILRHFHLGSQILAFIAANSPAPVSTSPLTPRHIDDLADHLFVKHDINLFNFVIRLNQTLREAGKEMGPPAEVDFSMIEEPLVALEDMPHGRSNVVDLQSAIELFTPVYQLLLTDNDFWRAANSLQLDETIGIYAAQILQAPQHLILLNNKHPLVPMSTLRAGYRLVLHGLSSEMLHALLMQMKADAQAKTAAPPTTTFEESAMSATPRMTNLFLQLGLDADDQAIADFIGKHQLPADVQIAEAPYWNAGQRQFLAEKIAIDGEWSTIVDQLNESLHEDAVKRRLQEEG